ncbi:MAG: iron-sulfur cluster repair di-iron protein [Nitrospinae bacterium]|nr:iron-sulfur cluster repair di-iron protein [Nitrospinota bacterium]
MSAKTLDIHSTINDFIKEDMRRAAVFERLGIDGCCGGQKTLAEACAGKGLDPRNVLGQIYEDQSAQGTPETGIDLRDATLTELADHVEQTHHVHEKQVMPRLTDLIEKVMGRHGNAHQELKELKTAFDALRSDMEQHMMKEEKILFPMIRKLDADISGEFHCGPISSPIRVMLMEHDRADGLLREIRRLTANHTAPGDACRSYHAMLEELQAFEADLRLHMHKENEYLFPRTLAEAGGGQ